MIKAKADKNVYEKGIKIDDETLQNINLTNKEFRGGLELQDNPVNVSFNI